MAKKKAETMPSFMTPADLLDSDYITALWTIIRAKYKGDKADDLFGKCVAVLSVMACTCTQRWDKTTNRKGAFIACGIAEDLGQIAEGFARKLRMNEKVVMVILELCKQVGIIAQREDDVWWCPMWVTFQSPAYVCELYETILDNLKSAKSGKGGKMPYKEQQEFIVASMCRTVSSIGTGSIKETIRQWAADYVTAHGDEATTAREWAIYCESHDVPGEWAAYCAGNCTAMQSPASTTSKKRRGKTVKPVDVLADDFMDEPVPAIPETAQPEPVQPVMVADEPTETEPEPDQYSGMGCDDWQAQAQPETMCEFEPEEPEDWMLENADNFDAKPVPVPAPAPDPEPIQPAPDDSTDADEDGYLAALVADSNEPGVPCIAGDPAFGELA